MSKPQPPYQQPHVVILDNCTIYIREAKNSTNRRELKRPERLKPITDPPDLAADALAHRCAIIFTAVALVVVLSVMISVFGWPF
jgi:hypothetical protein